DVFYYVTIMNESYAQPSMPAEAREGILRGMYKAQGPTGAPVRLLGAGTILVEALAAGELLRNDWDIEAEVFSVTSFTELRREAMAATRASRLAPSAAATPSPRTWIETQLPRTGAPVVAASDYVGAVPDLIRPWIADPYVVLGTDGFGRSDTRAHLRRFFEVDRHAIAAAALHALGDARVAEAVKRYGIDAASAPPWTR
ncbi:MAG TPA: pyruvate dehydrogenase (acetyl-transferring), homodimeric type, partial [Usitatibacter sp.]|nr:pyruvate dehydrogenase (acetyl-transferring), homodimeric type [Usitatibacter sp.]